MLARSDLRPYQERAVAHFKRHAASAGHMDMGLGKTVSRLTAFADQLNSFDARRMLVVAPLRVARKVWSDEIKQWSHLDGLTISRIIGTPAERLAALKVPADIHTINRENLPWLEAQFFHNYRQTKKWPWDTVVLDESQSFKSPSGAWHSVIRRTRKFFPQLTELTGTCAPNGLMDLWGQFYLLDRGQRLGRTVKEFRNRWFTTKPMDGYVKWIPHDHAMTEITDRIADITLSLREEDYLDLPPVMFNPVRVELPGDLMAQYKRLERDNLLKLRNQKVITAVNAGACAGKMLQFASGAVYDEEGKWHHVHDAKLDALEELLEGLPTPTLIAYNFVHELDRITERLRKLCGKTKRWLKLDTDASFEEWKTGLVDYGVLHPGSAGHGLNDVYLSGAENLIWLGVTTNLEHYLQLNARLTGGHRRSGRNVVIHHIVVDDTLDVEYAELIARKDVTQDTVKRLVAEKAAKISS